MGIDHDHDYEPNQNEATVSDPAELELSRSLTQSQPVAECNRNKVSLVKTIVVGQLLSLTLCGVGTTSTALSRWYGVHVPGFQAFLTYSLLCGTFGVTLAFKHGNFKKAVKLRGWKYLLLGLVDVEANYLLTKSYTYTTLTSAQLCDSFTIPTVLVLSFIFLRTRYKIIHYCGVTLCVAGAVCLIFTDNKHHGENARNEILGDVFALLGAFLYGCSNVFQEFIVKNFSKTEFLGMLGICASFVSGIQLLIVEREAVAKISWTWHVVLLFVAFAVCQYGFYTFMPFVMTLSSAAVVNLSLLTSDLYTLLFGLFLFGYKFSYLYFIAFGGIMSGLILYNLKPTPVSPKKIKHVKEILNKDKDKIGLVENGHAGRGKENGYKSFLSDGCINPGMNGIVTPIVTTSTFTSSL